MSLSLTHNVSQQSVNVLHLFLELLVNSSSWESPPPAETPPEVWNNSVKTSS